MTITIPSSALHTGYQNDNAMNQFPYRSPALSQTGIYAQSINLIDVTTYDIDIFANWISHKPQETPMYSMLSFLGQGDLINTFQYHWWDEYEGTGLIDTGLYNLRTRDGLGSSTSGVPRTIGSDGEIGGKMIWNKAYILDTGIRYTNAWDTYLAAGCTVQIRTPLTIATYTAASTNMVPLDSESIVEIQETTPQTIGSKKLVSLGFARPATGKYAYITGNVATYINQMRSALLAQNYVLESFAGCTWQGTGSKTIYSIKYTSGTSFAFMMKFDQLATQEMTDHDTGVFDQKVIVNVKVDRFIFSEDADTFILVLDFAQSNEEFTSNSAVLASALDSSGNDGWWMCTKSTAGGESLVNATTIYIGDVFRFNQGVDVWTATTNSNEFIKVNTGLLIEQNNTSTEWTSTTTWNGTDRLFGLNWGTASAMAGGQSYLSKHGIINMFHDTGSAVSEGEGFSVEEQPGYTFTQEGKYNWVEFYNGKPYGITTARQGMKLGFGGHGKDNFVVLREREMTKAKKIMQNKCIWGKKSNVSSSTSDSSYKGTMSGILDNEMFDIPYLSIPLPVYNGQVLYYTDGGLMIKEWFNRIAKSVNYNASSGKWDSSTRQVFISLTIRNYINTTMSLLGSGSINTSYAGNVLGTQYRNEKVTNGDLSFVLEVNKVKTDYGDLTLIYDPSLDQDTAWQLPRHKFSHRSGLVRPKWLIFVLDKNSVKLKTFANRTPKIYGNLQPSNNPFVYKEGFSAAQTLEFRNEANSAIIDATPNL